MNSTLRKIIFFVLTVGMTYASYFYMIKPANSDLVVQKEKMDIKNAKLKKLANAPSVLEDLNKQLARLEESVKILESKLPGEKEIHTVLENVTIIAQKHGLNPKTIRTLKQNFRNGYIEQPIKMELHGDFTSYYSFLLALEKLDRITRIREMVLKKNQKKDGFTEASFVVSIFFRNSNV